MWLVKQSTDLQREDHHGEANGDGDADGHDDGVRVVEAGDHARHVRHAQRQHRLEGRKEGRNTSNQHHHIRHSGSGDQFTVF